MKRPRGYTPGDHLADCYRCGRTRLASTMKKHWQGFYVCPEHWEERHPQDFVKAKPDHQVPPWTQPPPEDVFIGVCSINARSAIPGYSEPGCMIPGNTTIDLASIPVVVPDVCNIFNRQGIPDYGIPGCMLPGFDPFVGP